MRLIADLLDYAEKEDLFTPFVSASIQLRLTIGRTGFVSLEALPKEARSLTAPRIERTGNGIVPYHCYDNQEYVLGIGGGDKTQQKFDAFWTQTQGMLRACEDRTALTAVRAFVKDKAGLRAARKAYAKLAAGKAGQNVMIALAVGSAGLVADRAAVRDHFRREMKREMTVEGPDICMVTGKPCNAQRLHARIKGVLGTGMPVPLISFDKKTSTQEGFEKGFNYPMGRYAMNGYTSALNHLVATSSAKISDAVSVVFWGPPQAADLARVISPYTTWENRQIAWKAVHAMVTQKGDSDLHVLYLKGSQGRIAVLGYDVMPARSAAVSILRFREHFGDASVVYKLQSLGAKRSDGSFFEVVDGMSKAAVIRALLGGALIPEAVLSLILGRIQPMDWTREEVPPHAQCRQEWFEFDLILAGHKPPPQWRKPMPATILEEPRLEDFVLTDTSPPEMAPYLVGCLVALEQSIKRQTHRRAVGGGPAVHLACSNPAVWYVDFNRKLGHYEEKLGYSTQLTRLVEDVVVQIKNIEFLTQSTPPSNRQKALIVHGYRQQSSFNHMLGRWSRQEWKRLHPKSETETEDKAAE